MVVLHVKSGAAEAIEFLHECSSSSKIEDVAESIVEIHNLLSKILHLSVGVRDLFPPGTYPDAAPATLQRALSEAEAYASKEQILYKRPLLRYLLKDHLRSVQKEFTACRMRVSSLEFDVSEFPTDLQLLDKETAQIWWAGKQLLKGKKLSDYVAGNEKTKMVVWLKSNITDKQATAM